ncbi:DUF4136 domain-containing protein [Massilia sp. PAMC28688]|uniref:DUF4136 domain-containing protein n=1 Tax=Massilia sp. PAMC28688 TaxID=2861283 RepID=UPI001C624F5D|nr:DUF4136 domain-containing protein [Massilia sp. PAMC28688]QYF91790.1 DUF4136 domain-containing protein [Massilia sp. PAMC28688]
MKRLFMAAAASLSLLLGGCATTIRSDVTTFHEWPAAMADKSYAFDAPQAQEDTLELRSYQGLVRKELARLGFREAASGSTPNLKVAMRFMTTDIPVRVIEPMYPMQYHPRIGFGHPFYRPYWGGRRYWGGWYSPFYDPFWTGIPAYTVSVQHHYKRELQLAIKSANDGRRLFDVTVHNTSRERSTPVVMPALVQSAFTGFPGVSGVARTVELKRED